MLCGAYINILYCGVSLMKS